MNQTKNAVALALALVACGGATRSDPDGATSARPPPAADASPPLDCPSTATVKRFEVDVTTDAMCAAERDGKVAGIGNVHQTDPHHLFLVEDRCKELCADPVVTTCHLEQAAVEAFLDRSRAHAEDGGDAGACSFGPAPPQKLVCEQLVTTGRWTEGCPTH